MCSHLLSFGHNKRLRCSFSRANLVGVGDEMASEGGGSYRLPVGGERSGTTWMARVVGWRVGGPMSQQIARVPRTRCWCLFRRLVVQSVRELLFRYGQHFVPGGRSRFPFFSFLCSALRASFPYFAICTICHAPLWAVGRWDILYFHLGPN